MEKDLGSLASERIDFAYTITMERLKRIAIQQNQSGKEGEGISGDLVVRIFRKAVVCSFDPDLQPEDVNEWATGHIILPDRLEELKKEINHGISEE